MNVSVVLLAILRILEELLRRLAHDDLVAECEKIRNGPIEENTNGEKNS